MVILKNSAYYTKYFTKRSFFLWQIYLKAIFYTAQSFLN